jgi:hypothetical protein
LRSLAPRQLIVYRDDTGRGGRYSGGAFGVISGVHDPGQQDLPVIAIDNQRRTIRYSIVSERAFDLGDQKSIVGPVSRGLVMMMRIDANTVVAGREGARSGRLALLRLNLTGAYLYSRQ